MMIETFDNAAIAAAEAIERALGEAIAARGQAVFIATGGRTPGAVYERLSKAPLDWSKVTVTLSDERWVDPASADSNEGLIRERLLQGPAAAAAFIGLKRGDDIGRAALEASARLSALPPADVALLGMGDDGHIASLFPGNRALAEGLSPGAPPCLPVPAGQDAPPPQPRLTLSAPTLNKARQILILMTGQTKRTVIEAAMAGSDPLEFPVRAILTSRAAVRILWSA